MKYFIPYFIFLFFFKSYTAQQYSFSNFTEDNGLTKNTVLSIAQMPNGEIWVGTHYGGIDVLNGKDISNIDKTKGIVDNVVYDIVRLNVEKWLITTNKGVSILKENKFHTPVFKDSLASTRIFTGLKDKQGVVWLATGKGLSRLINDTIVSYVSSDSILNSSSIIHISEDSNGSIWCASMGNHVFELSPQKKVKHYKNSDNLEYTFFTFSYNNSTRWFLTYKGIFALQNDTITQVKFPALEATNVYFHSCIKDSRGNVWIATNQGVLKINKKGKQYLYTEKNGLLGHEAWKILEDREQNIWITFKKSGLSKLPNETFSIQNTKDGLASNDVEAIYEEDSTTLWLGTSKGLNKLRLDKIETFKIGHKTKDHIKVIVKYKGDLYCLSASDLNIFSKKEYKNYRLQGENRFAGECIYIDSGRVFLGSSVQGVAEFRNNQIIQVNDSLGLDPMGVFSILKTKDGNWWYATEEGLYKHNGNELIKITTKEGLPTVKTRSLLEDNQNRLWVGNSEGIYYMKDQIFVPVYKTDSLQNNSVYSMCFDLDNNLWVGKIDGLDKIVFEKGEVKQIKKYNAAKGLHIGSLHNNAIAVNRENKLLVGTDKGLLTYNPDEDFDNLVESKTHITDIQLFSQPTNWSDYADSVGANGMPLSLELNYNQNYFTFKYIGICHKHPDAVRYKCKLEGLDHEWVERGGKRFVIYGNLKPGKYTFMLKSSNNEGVWNKEPVKFSFVIHPPFWQTWWFYSICILIVLGGVYSYLKIKRANVLITEKNKHITLINKEIEEKNHEIMDSINYAKRIQDSILPDSKLKYLLPKSFIYFQPKDVVSGDFYWFKRVENKFLIAAIDCTGNGVPGAFVSMIGFSGLNRAVNEYRLVEPSSILEKLSDFVVESFAKHESKSVNDGMDASLCSIDRVSKVLEYAGANNSMYIIRNNEKPILTPSGEIVATKNLGILREIKATRRPVGNSDKPIPFANHSIQLEKGDRIYLFTDGFPDQFGGDKGKKYMYKAFKRFLISIQNLPIEQQGKALEKEFKMWTIGKVEQVDDICILGIEV